MYKALLTTLRISLVLLLTFNTVSLIALSSPEKALAFQVDPLPEDNLVSNPWFRSSDSTKGSFDGWTVDGTWVLSQKATNPSPDAINGTSVKHGPVQHQGAGIPYVDGVMTQVMQGSQSGNDVVLGFSMWRIFVHSNYLIVNIYGGDSSEGPWTLAWTPFYETQGAGDWVEFPLVTTTIPQGYDFYKIEFISNFPDSVTLGNKVTAIYFSDGGTIPDPGNQAPVAEFSATPLVGNAPLFVEYDASASYDSDGSIVEYNWDFGDGEYGQGQFTNHTYANPGNYTATLTIVDDLNATDTYSKSISVTDPNSSPSNLLANGGLEEGNVGWVGLGSAGNIVNGTYNSGANSVEIQAPAIGSRVVSQVVSIAGGTTYRASGYVKTSGISNQARMTVVWRDISGNTSATTFIGDILLGNNDWTLRTNQAVAPASAVTAEVKVLVRNGSGTAWFDDVVLEVVN